MRIYPSGFLFLLLDLFVRIRYLADIHYCLAITYKLPLYVSLYSFAMHLEKNLCILFFLFALFASFSFFFGLRI